MQAVRYGRRWYVTPAALGEFSAALAAQSVERLNPPRRVRMCERKRHTERKRVREINQVEEFLKREGAMDDPRIGKRPDTAQESLEREGAE